jgi:hypothetical protein
VRESEIYKKFNGRRRGRVSESKIKPKNFKAVLVNIGLETC